MRDGVPVAGALISIFAEPSQATLGALGPGESVPLIILGRARTDQQGRYAVAVDRGSVPKTSLNNDGSLSLSTSVLAGRDRLAWTSPVFAAGSTWRSVYSSAPSHLRFDVGRTSSILSSEDPPSAWGRSVRSVVAPDGGLRVQRDQVSSQEALLISGKVGPGQRRVGGGGGSCTITATGTYTDADERFAAVYGWSGAKGTVVQTNGSSHVLGAAFTLSTGVWTATGSTSFSESSGSGASVPNIVDAWVYNKVRYRDYGYSGPACPNGSGTRRQPYNTQAFMSKFTRADHPTFAHCTPVSPGECWKSTGKNTTVSGGVALGPISVSAQAGWDSGTKIQRVVTTASRACGSNEGYAAAKEMEIHR